MTKSIQNLQTRGFVEIPYPANLRASVQEAIRLWKKFCDLSLDTKKSLAYSNGSTGVGYEFKDGSGNKGDYKENLDVSLSGYDWLRENTDRIDDPVALEFVRHAISLVDVLKPTVIDFAKNVQDTFAVDGLEDEVRNGDAAFFVRFIHYFGDRTIGQETASAHIDQSGYTLHLFESAPGLQCLTYDKEWIDMPVSEEGTVVIPSAQLQNRSKGRLRALAHRVVANPETAETGRYSAVCFVQLARSPKYNKTEYGRLQEKEPGFNYGMDHAEYSRMFK